jgi:citrate lyase alpha subunit
MIERGARGSFAAGGITGSLVSMLEAGLFRGLFDVQAFDLEAVASYRQGEAHQGMSASLYANPHNRGCVAVNPRRPELKDRFKLAGLDVMGIEALHALAEKEAGKARPSPAIRRDRVVAAVEYRDGTVIDIVGAVETASAKTWSDSISPDRG